VQVDVSPAAAEFVRDRGGRLWVWVANARVGCCARAPYMYAATQPPPGLDGFSVMPQDSIEILFRAPRGRVPAVLEIALRGRRRPRVEAYWDGCIYAI
jgi:hypothetical protein